MTPPAGRELTLAEALNEALRDEMHNFEELLVVGEDIGVQGGLFGVTAGLLDEFGPGRVIDSPISEAAIVGMGIGAALVGARAVIELQIADFLTLTMDQLVNHAAKWRYMSGGQVSVPIVVRGPVSNGFGMAAQHSQSLEAWLVHTPGLKVIMPSNPYDAKGLLSAAIRDENPVVCLEKRLLYGRRGTVPREPYTVALGQAKIVRPGRDLTIVAAGQPVHMALQAARRAGRDGVEAEVIDLRTLRPWDVDAVASSVRRTGRLVVVNEGARTGGFASEVVARTIDEIELDQLRAKPQRVTAKDAPIPYAASLERVVLPAVEEVTAAIERVMAPLTEAVT